MARTRSLLLTLTRLGPSLGPTSRLTAIRRRSNSPETLTGDVDKAASAVRTLEEAVHRVIVKKAEPSWIPLVPGGSYWVPPRTKARGFAEVVRKLAASDDDPKRKAVRDRLSSSRRGWPSSACFFKGASHSPLEGETASKPTSQSEDEEK